MALGSRDHSKGLCIHPKEKWNPRWIQSERKFICNSMTTDHTACLPPMDYSPWRSSCQQLPLSEKGQAIVDNPRYQSLDCLKIMTWFFGKNSFESGLCSQQHITGVPEKLKVSEWERGIELPLFSSSDILWRSWAGQANSQHTVSLDFHLLRKMALQTLGDILGTLSWVKFGVI